MSFAYLPLYTGDYLRDTSDLSPREHGAYLLMLMWCWQRAKPMPNDMLRICRIACARDAQDEAAVAHVLAEFFELGEDDCYHNRRLEAELQRSASYVDRAKAGAAARWNKPKADAKQMLDACLVNAKPMPPSPSPSPSLNTITIPDASPPAPSALSGKPARKRADKPAGGGVLAWGGYSSAYEKRYGVEPVRNASVNAKLAMFAGKIGEAEAADVARFYVGHQNRLYVGAMHPVDLLLRDAERLRTEWATGRTVTSTQATQADKTQTNANVFGPMIEQARREEADAKR